MEVTEDVIQNDSGKKFVFGVVRKQPCALIIPWDGQYLTLVGQDRYPVEFFSWEFPMGHFEPDLHADMEAAARAELKEETGLTAGSIKKIGQFYIAPGHHTQVCHVYIAQEFTQGKQELSDSEEGMLVKKATLCEFEKMINDGTIKDGLTLSAYGIIKSNSLLK